MYVILVSLRDVVKARCLAVYQEEPFIMCVHRELCLPPYHGCFDHHIPVLGIVFIFSPGVKNFGSQYQWISSQSSADAFPSSCFFPTEFCNARCSDSWSASRTPCDANKHATRKSLPRGSDYHDGYMLIRICSGHALYWGVWPLLG